MVNDHYVLKNGVRIPRLGLGTWLMDDAQAAEAVAAAVNMGYRMIDTAQAYGNEAGVGEGIKTCQTARSELFIGSKIAAEHKSYREAADSIDRSLKKLQLDYLDQMIIHSPQPWVKVNQSEYRYEQENLEVWRALTDARKAGKIRVIGVSNFNEHDLQNIMDNSAEQPQVDQVLAHISNTPFGLLEFCKEHGILAEAYSPIAHGVVLNDPLIKRIAAGYKVSAAQLCLRYTLQLGMLPLPKTTDTEHMKNNAELDFEISDADMETLKNAEHIRDYGESSFFPVFGGKL